MFWQGAGINQAACDLAKGVADEGDALVAGGVSQTPTYLSGMGKDAVQDIFRKQIQVFVDNKVDFLICEVCLYKIYTSFILPDSFESKGILIKCKV